MTDELPPGDVSECPFCGAVLITDDVGKKIHHAAPLCVPYRLVMARAGAGRVEGVVCYVCKRDDVELRPYGEDDQPICFACMKADPERERKARARMGAALAGAGDLPVLVRGVGIISMEEAERRGLADQVAIIDTRTGQILPKGSKP